MNKQTHTPGPWGIEKTENKNWIGPLRRDGKIKIIVVSNARGIEYKKDYSDQSDADAALIAAAPVLLEAAKRQVEHIERWIETDEPADPTESQSIYTQLKAAVDSAVGHNTAS